MRHPKVLERPVETVPSTVPRRSRGSSFSGSHRVILYNDDVHTFDEVAEQLVKATGCSLEKGYAHATVVDAKGRDVVYGGSRTECEKVADILRQIRLQVETDTF